MAHNSVVILLFLWSRSVLLVMLGSVTYLWSPGKLAGCWMFPGGLNHMTGDWQAWLILKWTGSPHVQVVSHFLAGYFSFVCMGLSDFQACTEWTLFQLSTCVTFANIPWTKASHMVSLDIEWRKKTPSLDQKSFNISLQRGMHIGKVTIWGPFLQPTLWVSCFWCSNWIGLKMFDDHSHDFLSSSCSSQNTFFTTSI